MGYGISDRRVGGAGDMWWGVVPLAPVTEPVETPLTLRAELEGGLRAEARLATWRLVPALDVQPVPLPAGKGDAGRPLIASAWRPSTRRSNCSRGRSSRSARRPTTTGSASISDDNSRPERLAEIAGGPGGRRALRARALRAPPGLLRQLRARARAGARSRRDYLALADQDDSWHPDKLEVLLGELEERRGARVQRHADRGRERPCALGHLLALPATTTTRTSPRW